MTNDKEYERALKVVTASNESNSKDLNENHNYADVETIFHKCGEPHTLFVVSGRSSGKSWSTAKFVIDRCLKENCQFILLTWNIIQSDNMGGYFNHVPEMLNLKGEITVKSDSYFYRERGKETIEIGRRMPLSMAENYKSGAFPNVKYIIFEEFILTDTSRYYIHGNPLTLFGSLMSTIFRSRNDGHIIFLGNIMDANSYNNPFITAYNIPADDIEIDTPWTSPEFGGIAFYHCHMAMHSGETFVQLIPFNDVANTGQPVFDVRTVGDWLREHGLKSWDDIDGTFPVWYSFWKYGYFKISQYRVSNDDIIYNVMEFSKEEPRDECYNAHGATPVSHKDIDTWRTGLILLTNGNWRKAWARAVSETLSYWDTMTVKETEKIEEPTPIDIPWFIDADSVKRGYPMPKEFDDRELSDKAMDCFIEWNGRI